MPDIEQIVNLEDGSDVRTKLNAAISQVNTNTAALTNKQPLDADLTKIASLTATTDNFIVSVASAWESRTPAQVKTTLSLNNVENTADIDKPVSTATTAAIGAVNSSLSSDISALSSSLTALDNAKENIIKVIMSSATNVTVLSSMIDRIIHVTNIGPTSFTLTDDGSIPPGVVIQLYNSHTSSNNITVGVSGTATIQYSAALTSTVAPKTYAAFIKLTAGSLWIRII